MPVVRAQCAFQLDSALPRDAMVITPHFTVSWDPNNPASEVDGQQLAEDLAIALDGWAPGAPEVTVKIYDAQGTVPVFPIGEHVVNAGMSQNTLKPRELAICLSYYASQNIPRKRGRLYIPVALAGGDTGLRPDSTQRQRVADLVPIFTNLGGANVDWAVYSRVDDTGRTATNWWVDDEWDVMRSRGLQSTTRLAGTTGE